MSQKFLKLLVPLCMVLGIGVLWYTHKGQHEEVFIADQNATQGNAAQGSASANNNLYASHIDLAALQKEGLPMIIDFGADSCVPCKEMAPVLVKLHAEMQGKAVIKFVDVWKNPDGAKGFPVQVIPTQLIFNANGTPYTPKDVTDIQFTMYRTKESEKHVFTAHQGGLNEEQMRRILEDMGRP